MPRFIVLVLGVFLCDLSIHAAKKSPKTTDPATSTLALFPLLRNGAIDAKVADALDDALKEFANQNSNVLQDPALSKTLKGSARDIAAKCSNECLEKLSKKSRLSIILSRLKPRSGKGVVVQFLFIRSDGRSATTYEILSADDARATAEKFFREVLNLPTNMTTKSAEPELVALELEPLTPHNPPSPQSPPPTPDLPLIELPPVQNVAPTTPQVETSVQVAHSRQWLTIGGIGATGIGLAAIGIGAWQGIKSKQTWNKIDADTNHNGKRDPDEITPQVQVNNFQEQGRTYGRRANILYVLGGCLTAAGIGAVAADLMFFRATPNLRADLGFNGFAISGTF